MDNSKVAELVQELEDHCIYLSDTISINSGGCCYVSAILAEGFKKLKIPYKLVIADDYIERGSLKIRASIKNKEYLPWHHSFIYLHKHKLYINSDNCINYYRLHKVGCLNCNDLITYYDSREWNNLYNTDNNTVVAESIREIFKKYEV